MREHPRVLPVPVRMPAHGLHALVSRHGPRFSMAATAHAFAKLIYVVEGEGAIVSAGGAQPLRAGDAVLVPPGVRHRLSDRTPMRLYALCLDADALAGNPLIADAWSAVGRLLPPLRPRPVADHYHQGRIEARLRALLFEQVEARPAAAVALWGQALVLLADLVRGLGASSSPAPSSSPAFAAALTWLDHHFHQPVGIAGLARRAGLSYRGFTARFRRHAGVSVLTHLRRLRIAHAGRLLAAGTAVLDAAHAAGYGDLSHFYRDFRRQTGVTPAAWARGARSVAPPTSRAGASRR